MIFFQIFLSVFWPCVIRKKNMFAAFDSDSTYIIPVIIFQVLLLWWKFLISLKNMYRQQHFILIIFNRLYVYFENYTKSILFSSLFSSMVHVTMFQTDGCQFWRLYPFTQHTAPSRMRKKQKNQQVAILDKLLVVFTSGRSSRVEPCRIYAPRFSSTPSCKYNKCV